MNDGLTWRFSQVSQETLSETPILIHVQWGSDIYRQSHEIKL